MSINYEKPDLHIQAYYNWSEIENWLDSAFMDSMYVVAELENVLFKKRGGTPGFYPIKLEDDFKHEDPRVEKLYNHVCKNLSINDTEFQILYGV